MMLKEGRIKIANSQVEDNQYNWCLLFLSFYTPVTVGHSGLVHWGIVLYPVLIW